MNENNFTSGNHKIDSNGMSMMYYVPETVNEQTKVFYYLGGSGGNEQWDSYITSHLQNNPDSNAIIVCVSDYSKYETNSINQNVTNLVSQLYSNSGVENIPNIDYAGWSAGAKSITKAAAEYYMNPSNSKENGPKVVYAIDWGHDLTSYNEFSIDNPEDKAVIDVLAENNVVLTALEGRMSAEDAETFSYRLSPLQIETTKGVIEESFYIPSEYIKISENSDLKIVLATFPPSGTEGSDHTIAPSTWASSIIPSLCTNGTNESVSIETSLFGTEFTYNENASEQYEWYILEDGIAHPISFREYIEFANGEREITIYEELTNKYSGSGEIVESDLNFTIENMEKLKAIVKSMNILDASMSTPLDNGMATFNEISGIYNNYLQNSQALLGNVSTSFLNVINIATSLKELDYALANQISNGIDQSIANLDIDIKSTINGFTGYNNKLTQGENIKLTIDMIDDALSGNNMIINVMAKDIEDTIKLYSEIEQFIEDSKNTLKGPGWDTIRIKLGNYCIALREKNNYAEEAIDKFNESYQKLREFIEDEKILDTSKIPEVEQSIRDLENQIISLQNLKASLEAEHGKEVCDAYGNDANGNPECIASHIIDNSAKIAATDESIALANELKDECIHLLNKLNTIHTIDRAIAGALSFLGITPTAYNFINNIFR